MKKVQNYKSACNEMDQTGEVLDIFEAERKDFAEHAELIEQYGGIHKHGLAFIQQPYIDGTADERPFYRVTAVHYNGDHYEVRWDVKDNWEEIEDESEMCDWDNPESIDAI